MSARRLLKTSSPYTGYVDSIYRNRPNLAKARSSEQQRALLDGFFGWADAWKFYLEQTGRFQVEDVVVNAQAARIAWASERGIGRTPTAEEFTELLIAEFRPDVWFCHTSDLPSAFIRRLRRSYPFMRLVVGYDGVRIHDPATFDGCDMILTCLRDTAEFYRAHGFASYYFPHSFDERVLTHVSACDPQYDVSFVGGVRVSRRGHNFRIDVLHHVSRALPLHLWLADPPTISDVLRAGASLLKHRRFPALAAHLTRCTKLPRLLSKAGPALYGLEMYRTLARSRITLNVHIDAAGSEAANIRLFEATGIGTCLLTDWKPNLPSLFRIDEEIVAFRTPAEAVEKIVYLLAHEGSRKAIARQGQARTLAEHSVKRRLLDLATVLEAA